MNLTITVAVTFPQLPQLGTVLAGAIRTALAPDLAALEQTMSQISDKIAELTGKVDGAIARSQQEHQTLAQQIADLQAKVDQGGATPEDLAAIDALEAKLDALDPANPTTLPTDGTNPPPAP